ncbi:MAG: NAD(P)/FAD-dependent oxidoreductase [Oscillospiraceae bacterium]|nr:NAD(P)/FAD-dependent oxidoreductase [Oscillospiraceae bacterium]
MQGQSTEKQKALIIGAGPAGLTAAYTLLTETDIEPVILEASPYIGGISRTAQHNGHRIDIGGHRFFSKSAEVNRLWESLLPLQGKPSLDDKELGRLNMAFAEGGPDPETDDSVMLLRTRISRILFAGKFFDYPISMKAQTFANMGFRRTMAAGFGYMRSAVFKRPEHSLEDFYINRFGTPLYRMFFEDYTEKVWGVHPSNLSADWGAQRVKGLSLGKTIVNAITKPFRKGKTSETSLIEQFHYPKKGPGQYWETMADKVRELGGTILTEKTVDGIRLENGRIASVQTTDAVSGQKESFTADYYLSSMAIKDLFAAFSEGVPEEIRETAVNLPYRDFMTVGLLVKELNLKNSTKNATVHGGVPDCWIYIQEREVRLGRLQIFNNWSPYMVADPRGTIWIGLEYFCNEGDDFWNMSDEDFIRFSIDELVKIKVIEPGDVLDSVRLRVKKAYPAYYGAYDRFESVRECLDGISNLYCIGRNGQHRYNNMDHSMLTATEAVRVIQGLKPRSAVWNVNSESEYHEEKSDR